MTNSGDDQGGPTRTGRQPSTTRAELSHIALKLFIDRGYENTTVDDVAAAAGVSRRTLFRYFPSKSDLPWGDFTSGLDDMRTYLQSLPAETPLVEALSASVVEFNRFPVSEIPYHRERMNLLLNVPALAAHSTLRYADWRRVVADYAGERLGLSADAAEPQTIAWTYLGISLSAYEQWLKRDDADLTALLREAMHVVRTVFTGDEHAVAESTSTRDGRTT